MTTIVVGGGLLGLSTAQALIDRGEEVVVLEANDSVGAETSFANGGMLTPSLSEPWNSPGVFRHLLTSLFVPGAAMKLRLRVLPSLLAWGLGFIRHSSRAHYLAAVRDNYRLADYSLMSTREMSARLELRYDLVDRGTLCIYRDETSMAERMALCTMLGEVGLTYRQLDPGGVVDIEPVLAPIRQQLAGGIWLPGDARGDARKFCVALAAAIEAQGGAVRTAAPVDELLVDDGRIAGVVVDGLSIEANRVVVAAGVASSRLLASLNFDLPVQPAKGYSITVDGDGLGPLPDVSIGDDSTHTVMTSLGGRLRVAGTAEFAGYDKRLTPSRIAALCRALETVLPEIARRVTKENVDSWAGLRPMSNDGRPFIGPTPVEGLFLNTGHGALGWTMAAGSGQLLADLALGRPTAIDAAPFHPAR